VQDDLPAFFAYDRWANTRVLDACRKLTQDQYAADPIPGVPGWSSVRSTLAHIALVTDLHLRTLAADPGDRAPAEADPPTVDDAARTLDRAYQRFETLRPALTPQWLAAPLTIRGHDPRIGHYAFTLPRWAILRHIVTHSTYHRGQLASKLKRFGIDQPNTDFFFWTLEHHPQQP
jgi:uncharacterized damage-inducible protein DinB